MRGLSTEGVAGELRDRLREARLAHSAAIAQWEDVGLEARVGRDAMAVLEARGSRDRHVRADVSEAVAAIFGAAKARPLARLSDAPACDSAFACRMQYASRAQACT